MSQKSVVLAMLKEAGSKGVDVHELVYRRGITRAAAIVFDLRDEGFDIETVQAEDLPDGRKRLARYVLKNAKRTLPPKPPAGLFDEPPVADGPVVMSCGCVRAAGGMAWERRCAGHTRRTELKPEEVVW